MTIKVVENMEKVLQPGFYTYNREPKFDPKEIHRIFSKKAAIED